MVSLTTPSPLFAIDRRLAGVAATLLLHLALIVGWQMARQAPPVQHDGPTTLLQWIDLPAPAPVPAPVPKPAPAPETHRPALPPRTPSAPAMHVPAAPVAPATHQPIATPSPAAADAVPAAPSAAAILDHARRSVGEIDRALRKESKPTIVLPPDSPQIRMRDRMQQAHDLAPPRLWEAPKVAELVNNTGDGARRTRVINGNRTYCITERPPHTSIDMIEKHGKQTFTNCPKHEEPAKAQVWRTARD